MPAPDRIKQLIETFEQNIAAYHSQKNETELRRQFLDPFFEALGWDVDNKKGYDERSKEVAHEYSVEIDGAQKKADYAFRVGRDAFDFLVEAKKPSVRIESNLDAAFQIRRYGWSAGLPVNILTDFEHFAVYDCRTRPNYSKDKVGTGLLQIFHYKDYIKRWDELAGLFSPDAIRKGALDSYRDQLKGKKGTQEVDEAFLEEIEAWRETLAKNIALRNKPKNLTEEQINFAVQMTIDRIIFLRIAEERGMEKDRRLFEQTESANVYRNLRKLFEQADARYNSGLFHFKKEKDRENPDTLTPTLEVDDKVLKDIIRDLYYPSPYAFNYIPADILGSVYERFLGKVIRLTAERNAKVDEKPEVRKAGGVYYTPTYIVDYIVKNTVGRLLDPSPSPSPDGKSSSGEGSKTPDEVSKIKIVDPACGSGSFLLGAYQFLLDWHLDWYIAHDLEKSLKKKILLTADNKTYRLSLDEKKRILLNNIHGVDIDPQAVEVTKLSLLLKVVEDPGQLTMFEEGHILPNLNRNIKNGNALIGTDYFSGQMFGDMEEMKRVKPFDWKDEFPEVFRRGGFDVVIGNPPYRMMQPHNTEIEVLEYLRSKYLVAEFKMEMFHMFLQLGISILKQQGFHSFIIPATILNNVYAEKLRNWITNNCAIQKISVANEKVFEDADVHTLVLTVQRESSDEKRKNSRIQITTQLNKNTAGNLVFYGETKQKYFESLEGSVWNILIEDKNAQLILRLNKNFSKLSDVSTINRGLITGDREKYFSDKKLSDEHVQILAGSDVGRYFSKDPSEYVLFRKPKGSGGSWDADMHLASHKILVRQIGTKPMASLIIKPIAVTGNLFTIRASNINAEYYILGIFNSKLIEFFWKIMFSDFKNSFPQVTIFSISQLPIRALDLDNPAEKSQHDTMVSLVEQMLALHKNVGRDGIPPNEKVLLERQIKSTDRQIDELVYRLYGLTEEEIQIVEG